MRKIDPYSALESRIRNGVYAHGTWLASERELAGEFGVHRNVIRRAVTRLAEAGMLECRRGRRPVVQTPNGAAEPLQTVALLMGNEPRFHAFQFVAHGCEEELRAAGHRLLFMNTLGPTLESTRNRERDALASLVEHPVAGVILWCQEPANCLDNLGALTERGTPVVAIDRRIDGFRCDHVGVDNRHAASLAADHLLGLGHTRIAFALWREDMSSTVRDRLDGFRKTLKLHGLPIEDRWIYRVPKDTAAAAASEIAENISRAKDRPTALFAINDILAGDFRQALESAGMRVPEDIALVGVGGMEDVAFDQPFLTTLRQPYEAFGRHAAHLVLQRMKHPDAPICSVLLETELMARASTRPGAPSTASGSLAPRGRLAQEPAARVG